MISEKVFNQQMREIKVSLGVETTTDYLLVMYKHLANEFNDEMFIDVCHKILANEDLYGKMPTVRHFTKYLPPKITVQEEQEAKKQAFLEKVSNYLLLDFVTQYDRDKFSDMTEIEYRTLQSNGGLSEMWSRVHSLDYPCKISTILKELGIFYDSNCTRENVERRALVENRSGGMKSLGELLLEKVNDRLSAEVS